MADSDVRNSVRAALQEFKLRTRGAPSAGHYSPKLKLTRKRPVSVLMAERIRMHAGSSDAPFKDFSLGPRSSPQTYNTDIAANLTHKVHPRGTIGNEPRQSVLQADEIPLPGPSDYLGPSQPSPFKKIAGFSKSKSKRFPAKLPARDEANSLLNPQQGAIRVQHPRVIFTTEARPHDKVDDRLPVPGLGSGPGYTFSPGPGHYNSELAMPLATHSGTINKQPARVSLPTASGADAYMAASTSTLNLYRNAGPKYLKHGQETKIRMERSPAHKLLGRHGTSLGTGRDWLFASCN